jgi:hypothetical protein
MSALLAYAAGSSGSAQTAWHLSIYLYGVILLVGIAGSIWLSRTRGAENAIARAAFRALAGIVLVGGVLAAFATADYFKQLVPPPWYGQSFLLTPPRPVIPPSGTLPVGWAYATPWWAYAVAGVVALLGLALAVVIYPGRRVGRGQVPDTPERWHLRTRLTV